MGAWYMVTGLTHAIQRCTDAPSWLGGASSNIQDLRHAQGQLAAPGNPLLATVTKLLLTLLIIGA